MSRMQLSLKYHSCGPACAAVITQSPEVKTTKITQPQSHGKQANTK